MVYRTTLEEQHKMPLARDSPITKKVAKGQYLVKNVAYRSTAAAPKSKEKKKMSSVLHRQLGERVPWTESEVKVLLSGIEKYGVGKWAKIKADPEFRIGLAERDAIHLKDKVCGN